MNLNVPDAGERHPENVEASSVPDTIRVQSAEDRDDECEEEWRGGEELSLRSSKLSK